MKWIFCCAKIYKEILFMKKRLRLDAKWTEMSRITSNKNSTWIGRRLDAYPSLNYSELSFNSSQNLSISPQPTFLFEGGKNGFLCENFSFVSLPPPRSSHNISRKSQKFRNRRYLSFALSWKFILHAMRETLVHNKIERRGESKEKKINRFDNIISLISEATFTEKKDKCSL